MISATVRAALVASLCAACLPSGTTSGPEVILPGNAQAILPKGNPPKEDPGNPYEVGRAAWYGSRFQGRLTANGERFNMYHLTAAHRRLPFGSLMQVTNLENRRSVVVRINDRGPWGSRNRIIDLSYAASQALGMVNRGVAKVRLDSLASNARPGRFTRGNFQTPD